MDEDGNPTALATVNRWVTDDKYVKAEQLKILFEEFKINPKLFKDERLLLFIQNILVGYRTEIFELFDKRDEWIKTTHSKIIENRLKIESTRYYLQ